MIIDKEPGKVEVAPSQTISEDCLEPDSSCATMAAVPVEERLQKLQIIREAGIRIACNGELNCGLNNVAKCLLRGVMPGNPGPDGEKVDQAAAALGMLEDVEPRGQLWQTPPSPRGAYATQ